MKFEYKSDNLIYRILNTDCTNEVLDFYIRNKEVFQSFEPLKEPNYYTVSYHEKLIRLEYEQFLRGLGARFWIYEKENSEKIIGTISFNNVIRGIFRQARIGYRIDFSMQNRGIGTKAVDFCCRLMLDEGRLHRIEAYIHSENLPSLRLAEKCGFIHEGTAVSFAKLADGWNDFERYVLIGTDQSASTTKYQ